MGKPMIAWAVEHALSVPEIERVVVSTDSPAIASAAVAAGAEAPFMRPPDLARSDAGKFQVWQHALAACEKHYDEHFDVYVDIDCTNPLIESSDIAGAIAQYRNARAEGRHIDAVFTIAPARRNPYFNLVEPDPSGAMKMSKSAGPTVLARQSAPPVFEHVAGVYVLDPAYLRSAKHLLDGHAEGYLLPPEKALDVDSELDFQIIEYLLRRRSGQRT
jgi:CMP-N-acetylneuraminic acid synthetase